LWGDGKMGKKKEDPGAANVSRRERRERGRPKSKPIIMFLGREIKEYGEKSLGIIKQAISEGKLLCERCLRPMAVHSSYPRGIKETGEKIRITMVWCSKCREWHAVLPDFLLPNKHYSANEIEGVIIDGETTQTEEIETVASETTVKRWLKHVGESIMRAVAKLKYHFGRKGRAVSEVAVDDAYCYAQLELLLEKAPKKIKTCGNKLGLANIWLGTFGMVEYIGMIK